MSDTTAESTEKPAEKPEAPAQEPEVTDWEAEATRLRDELTKARKWETRAKDNKAAADAAEKARLEAMSESERAIEEAKKSARTEAVTEFGKRLARTQFDALAGRRNAEFDTESALEYVDLTKFLDEDGEPDATRIAAAVDRLVPTVAPVEKPSVGAHVSSEGSSPQSPGSLDEQIAAAEQAGDHQKVQVLKAQKLIETSRNSRK